MFDFLGYAFSQTVEVLSSFTIADFSVFGVLCSILVFSIIIDYFI